MTDPRIERKIESVASEIADLAECFPEVWEGEAKVETVNRILRRTEEILLEPVPDDFDDLVFVVVQSQREVEG